MLDQFKQRKIVPSQRIFHIENIPQLLNENSNVHTKQILLTIDSKDEKEKTLLTYNHEPAVTVQSGKPPNQITFVTPVIRVEQPLSPPISQQLIPDFIINDKQTTKRIIDEKNATHLLHPSKIISLTPTSSVQNKTLKFIRDNQSSIDQIRYYQIGSILTSTNAFLMHKNSIVAHETRSDGLLSDTIFIILIVTLTIIILLFCLGLFCFCRRSTKRHISPSFDSSSYVKLNGHSYEMPFNDYPQQKQDNFKYENNTPLKQNEPLPLIPIKIVDNPPQTKTNVLHHTIKQKMPINNRKLKKKRAGCCCCHSKPTATMTINARTRL